MNTYKNAKSIINASKMLVGCIKCNFIPTDPSQIDLDHINPESKYMTSSGRRLSISDMIVKRYSYPLIMTEFSKCQFLCKNCHIQKTQIERKNK